MLLSFEVYLFVFWLILFWATTIPGRLVSFTETILQSKAAKVAGSGITYFYCILVEGDQYAPTTVFSHTAILIPVLFTWTILLAFPSATTGKGGSIITSAYCWASLFLTSSQSLHYLQTDPQFLFRLMRLLRDYLLFLDINCANSYEILCYNSFRALFWSRCKYNLPI